MAEITYKKSSFEIRFTTIRYYRCIKDENLFSILVLKTSWVFIRRDSRDSILRKLHFLHLSLFTDSRGFLSIIKIELSVFKHGGIFTSTLVNNCVFKLYLYRCEIRLWISLNITRIFFYCCIRAVVQVRKYMSSMWGIRRSDFNVSDLDLFNSLKHQTRGVIVLYNRLGSLEIGFFLFLPASCFLLVKTRVHHDLKDD